MISAVVTCIVVVSEKYLGLIIVFYARHRVGAGLRDCWFQAIIVGETRPYIDIVQSAIYHW